MIKMKSVTFTIYIILFSLVNLFSQDNAQLSQDTPYWDIANELIVRIKLSQKFPEVINNDKFQELAIKLDSISQLESSAFENRLQVANPAFHWCFANLYLLIGNYDQAAKHYNRYNAFLPENSPQLHKIFLQPIKELEGISKQTDIELSKEIYSKILQIKSPAISPNNMQIKYLQQQLNEYNQSKEINRNLVVDGIVGVMTKSVIYDFEKNNLGIISLLDSLEQSGVENILSAELGDISNSYNQSESTDFEVPGMSNELKKESIEFSNKIIINSDRIASLPVANIADLLEYVMGINILKRGTGDANASISAIGGTSQDVLILIDGFRILTDYTIYHDLNFPFGINDINKIEISHGSHSRLFGSRAISTVINIITKDAHSSKNRINIISGSHSGNYGAIHNNLTLNIPTNHSNHILSINDLGSSGMNKGADPYQQLSIYYKYTIENNANKTHMSFGYLDRINGDTTSANIYRYTKNISKFVNSKIRWDFPNKKLESNFHWSNNIYSINPISDLATPDTSEANFIGYGFKGILNNRFGVSTLGLLIDGEEHSSASRERIHYSFTVDHEFKWGVNQFDLGTSFNKYNDYNDKIYISSGYGINHWLNQYTILYHSYNQGFRIPSFEELNIETYEMKHADDTLKVEYQKSYDYGLIIENDNVKINFSMFYNKGNDVIEWEYTTAGTDIYWQTTNIPNIHTNGHKVNFTMKRNPFKIFNFVKSVDMSYIFLDVEMNSITDSMRILSNTFKHQGVLYLKHKLPFMNYNNASQTWILRYEEPINMPNRLILDTQFNYKLWKFTAVLSINNLLGLEYSDEKTLNEFLPSSEDKDNSNDILLPGTWVRFGLKFPS